MSALHEAARLVVAAWTSTRPAWVQECNAAVLSLGEALKAEPAGCETEADCTSQPWCRIRGACHRKQPEPAQEPAFHGFMSDDGTRVDVCFTPSSPRTDGTYATAYYTTPQPQRPPLTDEEMRKLWSQYGYKSALCMRFARAVERKVRGE